MATESVDNPVRIGLVGCASIAIRKMLPAVKRAVGATVVAVSSRTADRAEAVASKCNAQAVVGYQNLLDLADVEAVYIPLPNAMHAEWVERALAAGKHVLAEKPLTTSAARTKQLVDYAVHRGLVLAENLAFPHHAQHGRVGALLQGDVIGRLRGVSAVFTIPPRATDDIRYQRILGGGCLFDLGVYPIGVAQHLLGRGLAVVGASLRFEGGVDRSGSALLSRPDGATAHLSFGMEHAYMSRYEVHGSEGRVVVNQAYTPDPDGVPCVLVERGGKANRLELPPDDQYRNVITKFARMVRGSVVDSDPLIVDRARLVDLVRESAHCVN